LRVEKKKGKVPFELSRLKKKKKRRGKKIPLFLPTKRFERRPYRIPYGKSEVFLEG
jgi:hypothetical protein